LPISMRSPSMIVTSLAPPRTIISAIIEPIAPPPTMATREPVRRDVNMPRFSISVACQFSDFCQLSLVAPLRVRLSFLWQAEWPGLLNPGAVSPYLDSGGSSKACQWIWLGWTPTYLGTGKPNRAICCLPSRKCLDTCPINRLTFRCCVVATRSSSPQVIGACQGGSTITSEKRIHTPISLSSLHAPCKLGHAISNTLPPAESWKESTTRAPFRWVGMPKFARPQCPERSRHTWWLSADSENTTLYGAPAV
jgi:hypothetical protein